VLILNQQHLERILDVFVDHDNRHRPSSAVARVTGARTASFDAVGMRRSYTLRRDRLGGVVHE
jgi:hypothetical protein